MLQSDIKSLVNVRYDLRSKLYARGFLFTNARVDVDSYPFYGQWKEWNIGEAKLLVNKGQRAYVFVQDNCNIVLIGHAYNPFNLEHDENIILASLCHRLLRDIAEFFEGLNQLTGVFTLIWMKDGKVFFVGDATGMQTTFYTIKDDCYYISSHTNLLNDLLQLDWDAYVRELVSYRFFSLLGNYLPGDITQFLHVKRLVPNHYMSFSDNQIHANRFFYPQTLCLSRNEIRDQVAELLHNNLLLITKKWKKPAISMTGGCDSRTTLACANGLYDKFDFFSYVSNDAEEVDAKAAHTICDALKLRHTIFNIPKNNDRISDYVETAQLLRWNTGNIRNSNANDVRKRCFFQDTDEFDIEVKSWGSEVGRAYYSKRFAGRTAFGNAYSPRACTTLYKFFLHNRHLVRDTDAIFAAYHDSFFKQSECDPVPWQEQFFWEFRVPSWNGLVITGEHKYSFDITIPYNNRIMLRLLQSAPIEDRINDMVYAEIRSLWNPAIDVVQPTVTNLHHTNLRAYFENMYYSIHSNLPF